MDNLYRENILDHYKNPRNYGKMNKADIENEKKNISCGDLIVMQIKYRRKKRDNKGKIIEKIMFYGQGCAISTASASMLTERVKGKSLEEAKGIKTKDIIEMLKIPLSPLRLKCALLPLEALHGALNDLSK